MDDETAQILKVPGVKRTLELVGLTAVLWNRVESNWELIFSCLLHEAPREKSDQLLKHFLTGAAKRDFIMRLSEVAFAGDSRLRDAIDWLNQRTTDLAGKRNAIVHGVYRFDVLNGPPGLRVSPMGSTNRQPNRMAKAGHKLQTEIETTAEEIAALIDHLDNFIDYLAQNHLPAEKRIGPMSAEAIAATPPEHLAAMPRVLRERVELHIPPKTAGKS